MEFELFYKLSQATCLTNILKKLKNNSKIHNVLQCPGWVNRRGVAEAVYLVPGWNCLEGGPRRAASSATLSHCHPTCDDYTSGVWGASPGESDAAWTKAPTYGTERTHQCSCHSPAVSVSDSGLLRRLPLQMQTSEHFLKLVKLCALWLSQKLYFCFSSFPSRTVHCCCFYQI